MGGRHRTLESRSAWTFVIGSKVYGPELGVSTMERPGRALALAGSASLLIAAAALFGRVSHREASLRDTSESLAVAVGSSNDMSFDVWNEYTQTTPIKLYPWENIVEPYRESTFQIADSSSSSSDAVYHWKIDKKTLIGGNVTHTFTKIGIHPILVERRKVGNARRSVFVPPSGNHEHLIWFLVQQLVAAWRGNVQVRPTGNQDAFRFGSRALLGRVVHFVYGR